MGDITSDSASANAGIDLTQFYQVFFEEAGENLDRMEQQLLFHPVEVLARFFEEDLVELGQVDASAEVGTFGSQFAHGGIS